MAFSPQPSALKYSVKSYGERREVAAEISFPLRQPHSAIFVLCLSYFCARDEARELIHIVRYYLSLE